MDFEFYAFLLILSVIIFSSSRYYVISVRDCYKLEGKE